MYTSASVGLVTSYPRMMAIARNAKRAIDKSFRKKEKEYNRLIKLIEDLKYKDELSERMNEPEVRKNLEPPDKPILKDRWMATEIKPDEVDEEYTFLIKRKKKKVK